MKENLGIVALDLEVLAKLLDLPNGYRIQRTICPSNDYNMRPVAKFVIQGPEMPEVEDGYEISELQCWRDDKKGQIGFTQGKIGTGIILQTKSAQDKERMVKLEELRKTCPTVITGQESYVMVNADEWEDFQEKIEELDALTPTLKEKS